MASIRESEADPTGLRLTKEEALDRFVEPQTEPIEVSDPFNNPPHIRDAGTDDQYYEF